MTVAIGVDGVIVELESGQSEYESKFYFKKVHRTSIYRKKSGMVEVFKDEYHDSYGLCNQRLEAMALMKTIEELIIMVVYESRIYLLS